MRLCGLDPDNIMDRVRLSGAGSRIPSLRRSILVGSLGFTLVGLTSFAVWAFGGRWLESHVGELGLYVACATVFIGGGSCVFGSLVIGPERVRRFFGLFALSFFLYAGVWTGSFFSLRNKSGEWLATFLGPAILGMTFANEFGALAAVRKIVVVLVAGHSLGYFAGSILHGAFPGLIGKLLWGAAYGLGFGAAIGCALYLCQQRVRERLATSVESP